MIHRETPYQYLPRTAIKWALLGFVLTIAAFAGIQIHAQAIANHNSRAPVDFNAGRIELQDRQNRVILSGGVIVTQAGLTVRSSRMLIDYNDAGTLQINRLTATGGVTVSRGNERASGGVAVYDFGRRLITMAGNVRLRRGSDTLNGGRLVIDLASGISSVDGSASGSSSIADDEVPVEFSNSGGRVTGTFTVPQN